jgi:hypothetical protein
MRQHRIDERGQSVEYYYPTQHCIIVFLPDDKGLVMIITLRNKGAVPKRLRERSAKPLWLVQLQPAPLISSQRLAIS